MTNSWRELSETRTVGQALCCVCPPHVTGHDSRKGGLLAPERTKDGSRRNNAKKRNTRTAGLCLAVPRRKTGEISEADLAGLASISVTWMMHFVSRSQSEGAALIAPLTRRTKTAMSCWRLVVPWFMPSRPSRSLSFCRKRLSSRLRDGRQPDLLELSYRKLFFAVTDLMYSTISGGLTGCLTY